MLLSFVQTSTLAQFHFGGAAQNHSLATPILTGPRAGHHQNSPINPQAINPVTACPIPHQHAKNVSTHCLLPGRYSKNTVVSKIKFPPAPKPTRAMKNPSAPQLLMAPAMTADKEQMNSVTLKANRRPMMSAERPQKMAPLLEC